MRSKASCLEKHHDGRDQACVSQNSRKTFRARKAILCAGYLPTKIQFSFVLKAKRKNPKSTRNFTLVFWLKTSPRIKRD